MTNAGLYTRSVLVEDVLETIFRDGAKPGAEVFGCTMAHPEYYAALSEELLALLLTFESRAQAASVLEAVICAIENVAIMRSRDPVA